MKQLSEFKDEAALDLLADIIEPCITIFQDPQFVSAMRSGKTVDAVKVAIKGHKKEVIEVLASMDGVDVKEYHCNFLTLPMRLLDLFNDKELLTFFTSQGLITEETASGSPTENIEDEER